ncbi:DUF2116 family Zn-ribbon domain-containing protein [Ectopseudomonas khazarica]|nr:DUF2116 family Zn-ribbon domain-containing protein [Pseudomonas khazarica]
MPRCCVICGTEIEGRSNKILCSNACTIKLHRARKKALAEFKTLLLGTIDTEEIRELETLALRLANTTQHNQSACSN